MLVAPLCMVYASPSWLKDMSNTYMRIKDVSLQFTQEKNKINVISTKEDTHTHIRRKLK